MELGFLSSRLIIVCGHYGSGKTNVAVNLSLELKKRNDGEVCIVDMDTVNPYFRCADSAKRLDECGITLIAPAFANTNVDIPSLPAEIYSIFSRLECGSYVILDVGGDPEGSACLGFLGDRIEKAGYEMLCVVNKYRPLTATAEDAAQVLADIERASGLKCTYIVNNSNLGDETTADDVISSLDYAKEICKLTSYPLAFTSSTVKLDSVGDVFYMENVTKKIFTR